MKAVDFLDAPVSASDFLDDTAQSAADFLDDDVAVAKQDTSTFASSFDKGMTSLGVLAVPLLSKLEGRSWKGDLASALEDYGAMPSSPILENVAGTYERNSGITAPLAAVGEAITSPVQAAKYLTEMLPGGMIGGGAGGVVAKQVALGIGKKLALNEGAKVLATNLATGAGVNAGATAVGGLASNTADAFRKTADVDQAIEKGLKQTGTESAVAGVMGSPLNVGANSVRNIALKALGLSPADETLQTYLGTKAIGEDATGGELAASWILGGMGAPADIGGAALFKDKAVLAEPAALVDHEQILETLKKAKDRADAQRQSAPNQPETQTAEPVSAQPQVNAATTSPSGQAAPPIQPTQEQTNASQATETIAPETQQPTQGIPTDAVIQPDISAAIKPHLELLIKQRRVAGELGMSRQMDTIIAKAKEAMQTGKVDAALFNRAAKVFKDKDAVTSTALQGIAQSIAPTPVEKAKPKIRKSQRVHTLLTTIRDMGGLTTGSKSDVVGDRFAPGGYNQLFRGDSRHTIEGLVGKGELDDFLPHELRFSTLDNPNSEVADMQDAAEWIKDKIRSGERVIPYDAQVELDQKEIEAQSAIDEIEEDLSYDEINRELQLAADEERENATNAAIFDAGNEDGVAERGTGAKAGEGRPTLESYDQAEVTRREQEQAAHEAAQRDEETKARAEQAAKDQANLDARIKARADNPDNFQFGEDSKQASKPIADLFNQPVKPTAESKPAQEAETERLKLTGERVGGARKDIVSRTVRTAKDAADTAEKAPSWQQRYAVSQDTNQVGEVWYVNDTRTKRRIPERFYSKEAAEKAIPLIAVSQKHRVVMTSRSDEPAAYQIMRNVTDRKRLIVVPQTFDTREAAMQYMAEHAGEIIETKTSFGEEILPLPEVAKRTGTPRRTKNVTQADFKNTFGFNGDVDFGLWMLQSDERTVTDEGQEVANHAYDALMDLAEVLNVPPKALSLNGELAIAFGARGQGLSGARAHYEPSYGVINLTKMKGAGALAHEWLHAFDHYLGRLDGRAGSEKITNERGNQVYKDDNASNFASHGFSHKSKMREELQTSYKQLIETMFYKAEKYVEDTQKAEEWLGRTRDMLRDDLARIRKSLAEQKDPTYWKRNNKPATPGQLAEFDALADKLIEGQDLALEWRNNPNTGKSRMSMSGRMSNDTLDGISGIYKAVRGRSGFNADRTGAADGLRSSIDNYRQRIKMMDEARSSVEKTKRIPTEYRRAATEIDQGRASDYWATPHEMAARAFSSYVEDKIAAMGNQSDFLSYGSKGQVPTAFGWVRPFPSGEERAAINMAFDKLFSTIKTKETDKGVALFSQADKINATPQTVESVTKAIARLRNGWSGFRKISIVQSVKDVPNDVYLRALRALKPIDQTSEGVYDPKTNTVYLIADNLSSPERAVWVAAHEVVGHGGIRMLDKSVAEHVDRLSKNGTIEKLAQAIAKDRAEAFDLNTHVQEAIAELAATHITGDAGAIFERYGVNVPAGMRSGILGVIARIVEAVRSFMARALGKPVAEVSDSEVTDLIRQMKDAVEGMEQGYDTAGVSNGVMASRAPQSPSDGEVKVPRNTDIVARILPKSVPLLYSRDELGNIRSDLLGTRRFKDFLHAAFIHPMAVKTGLAQASPALAKLLRKQKADIDKSLRIASQVVKDTEGMTEAESALISRIVTQEMRNDDVPPEHAMKIAAAVEQAMTQQGQDAVDLKMLSPDAYEKWKGRYLPRMYMRHLDPEVRGIWRRTFKSSPVEGFKSGSLKGRGKRQVVTVAEFPQWESLGWTLDEKNIKRSGNLELTLDGKKLPDTDTVAIWKDYTPEERKDMGEIEDFRLRFVMGYLSMQRDLAVGRLYKTIAENPEWTRRTPSDGYKYIPEAEIPDTGGLKRYGMLSGMYVKDEILSHISQFEQNNNEFQKFYKAALSKWKEGKTVLNPVTHMNNFVSNITMAHFAGVSYWDGEKYFFALKDLVKNAPMMQEAEDAGLFTGDFSHAEIMKGMPHEIRNLVAGATDSGAVKTGRFIWNLWGALGLRDKAATAYHWGDIIFKYAIYRDARSKGMSPEDAVYHAGKYIFNYDDLPSTARGIRDYALPFFAYTYKVIPALAHTAIDYPWRFAAPATIIASLNALAYAGIAADGEDDDWWLTAITSGTMNALLNAYTLGLYGEDEAKTQGQQLEQAERKNLADWDKGASALGTPKTIRMGTDEKTGMPVFLNVYRFMPGGDIQDVQNEKGGIGIPAPFMPSNPLLTGYSALVDNRSWDGREMFDANDSKSDKAKKTADFLYKQVFPTIAPGGAHYDRIMQAVANYTDTTLEKANPLKDYTGTGKDGLPIQPKYAAMQTVGIKARPVNLELSADMNQIGENAEARSIKAEIRSAARQLDKGAISQREYDRILEDGQAKMEAITAKE